MRACRGRRRMAPTCKRRRTKFGCGWFDEGTRRSIPNLPRISCKLLNMRTLGFVWPCDLRGEAVSGAFVISMQHSEMLARVTAQFPVEFAEPHWYAAYTRANHEVRVTQQ